MNACPSGAPVADAVPVCPRDGVRRTTGTLCGWRDGGKPGVPNQWPGRSTYTAGSGRGRRPHRLLLCRGRCVPTPPTKDIRIDSGLPHERTNEEGECPGPIVVIVVNAQK